MEKENLKKLKNEMLLRKGEI